MSREDFLKYIGLWVVMVFGGGVLLKALKDQSGQVDEQLAHNDQRPSTSTGTSPAQLSTSSALIATSGIAALGPNNILASIAAANADGPTSLFASGATDNIAPTFNIEPGTGINGGNALKITAPGSGQKWVFTQGLSVWAPVTAGQTYTSAAHVQLVSGTAGTVRGHISWFTSTGNWISGNQSTTATPLTIGAAYTQVTSTAVAPDGAAYAAAQINFGAVSGTPILRADQFGVFAGTSATPWSPPGGAPVNQPPTASFTTTLNELSVTTNASASTDPDGSVISYVWSWGDATTSSGANASHTYVAAGTYVISLTVTDNAGATGSTTRQVTVTAPPSGTIHTLWPTNPTPTDINTTSGNPIEVGVKFRATQNATVIGVRFYKGSANTGTHTGSLWSISGTRLATVTFTGETASGWQQASFTSPVPITAGTTYIVSYYNPTGNFSVNRNYFTTTVNSGILSALDTTSAGGNGVFKYGTTSQFPNEHYNASNYWVDVIVATGTTPPPANQAPTASFTTSVSYLTVTTNTTANSDPDGVISSYTWNWGDNTTSTGINASHTYTAASTYTITLTVTDNAGATASTTRQVTVTAPASTTIYKLWPANPTPAEPNNTETAPIELGVKFRASQNGYATGVRFYKGSVNTGTHTGSLWSTSGTRLATVTFTGESASGWQEASFASAVALTAGTTYVVSYFSPTGAFSVTRNYFGSATTSDILTAPANSETPNGVFKYGSTSQFPTDNYNATNYWVDVIVSSTPPAADTTAPTAPTGLTATPSANSVALSWTASTDNTSVTGYEYSLSGTTYATTGSTTTYTITGLSPQTAYTIRLRAYDAAGNRSVVATVSTTTLAVPASSNDMPLIGRYRMPSTGVPSDPGNTVVYSPNPSPVVSASQLRGQRLHFGPNDNPETLNSMTLGPGTIVEFERGVVWSNVRVRINANGTADQPVLLCSVGSPSLPAPVFKVNASSKPPAGPAGSGIDDGVVNLYGNHVHMRDLAIKDSYSNGMYNTATNAVIHNCEFSGVIIAIWTRGQYNKIWNCYMHDLVVRTPDGPDNDYGASALTIEAHNLTVQGVTARNAWGYSPDYAQWGGDGSLADIWNYGDNLQLRHCYVDYSPRVLEAGRDPRKSDVSARNTVVAGCYAKRLTDAAIYWNPDGPYGGIPYTGYQKYDCNF